MSGYAQVEVRGADAFTFLQGQLSNDLRRLDTEPRLLAAWCNPKGRVIALLRVTRRDDAYRLALPGPLAEPVATQLAMFRFRARVEFATGDAAPDALGLPADGPGDVAAWQRQNLLAGIPEVGPLQTGKFTPHMLNLDRLDAISLVKGCYTGQEIVARTHYRGATRRRMCRFSASAPVAPGDPVTQGDRNIGEVVNAIDRDLLAVVPIEQADALLEAGGVRLVREPLPYDFA